MTPAMQKIMDDQAYQLSIAQQLARQLGEVLEQGGSQEARRGAVLARRIVEWLEIPTFHGADAAIRYRELASAWRELDRGIAPSNVRQLRPSP